MASTPHLSFPVRVDPVSGHLAEVEQDTVDDVAECVEVVLSTRPGERAYRPAFGTPDMAFQTRPLGVDGLVQQAAAHEPRARLDAVEDLDTLAEVTARVSVRIGTEV